MDMVIKTAVDVHGVRSAEHYRAAHAKAIAKAASQGARVRVHRSQTLKTARIDHGRWLVDCECGAANATDPEWGVACCLGCGAVHDAIAFPASDDRLDIEHVLLARRHTKNRSWHPGESLLQLAIENAEHGVRW